MFLKVNDLKRQKNDPLNQKNCDPLITFNEKKFIKFLLLSEFNQIPGNSF